jgi:FixJ family two-component response regulator
MEIPVSDLDLFLLDVVAEAPAGSAEERRKAVDRIVTAAGTDRRGDGVAPTPRVAGRTSRETGRGDGRVYVVDDDPAIRESLRWLLESAALEVETYDSAEAFLAGFDRAAHACIVLDVRMPGMSGLALQKELQTQRVTIPIIFISAFGDVPLAVRACREGALDFIEKPFRDDLLLARVREALECDRVRAQLRREVADFVMRVDSLTPREVQIMREVAKGLTNREIAAALAVSTRTVEVHRARLIRKLGVGSVAELVRLLLESRVPPEDDRV